MSDFRLAIGSPMHTILKKQARFPTSKWEKYVGVTLGTRRNVNSEDGM